jgi:signal transduction histidine kinase
MQDEIDPGYIFLVLNCRGEFIFTPITADGPLADSPENLIGSRIELTGVCDPLHIGSRMQIGKLVYSLRSRDIKLTKADKQALFNVPDISGLINRSPLEISKKDRHRTHGKVIAVYRKNLILVKTPSGQIVGAELADVPAPRFGQTVDLTGFPQSDLYHVNLARALWRPSLADADVPEDPVTDIGPAHRLMTDDEGRLCYNPCRHGTTVKCRGTVCSRLRLKDQNAIVNLQSGSSILSVDVSSLPQIPPEISVGCEIEVTGTCVLESEHWRPNMIFPKITQALIVPRSESDMVIIARPPWWTPGRLLLVISALLLALVAILAWNASLKVLAAKRGRELFKSQIAKVSSELRVSERTRLAVELHDSITQNLTGVTLQIDAAASARREDPAEAERILCVARRSLQSCLDELRRCLWDLRSEALEEQDFNTAIRIALKQVAGKSDIAIRFNISRNRLSDATAHAILRIIRELVSNAIRHGRADKIRIIGESLPNMIRFAVSDNGCGFDHATVPGPGDGHFGLSGIRERLKDVQGTLRLTSTPKGGTRAEIVIPLHCSPSL